MNINRPNTTTPTSPLRSLLLVVSLLLAGGLFLSVPSVAQSSMDAPPTLIEHLRSDIEGNDAVQRESALMDVIALATCPETCTVDFRSINEKKLTIANETGTSHVLDLNVLVPDLVKAYRSGPDDGHRLLALTALINIGNEKGLEQLIDQGARQSERTNRITQRSLLWYYMDKYPELYEQTMNTKQLSMDDVRRAEVVRVKHVKKADKAAKKAAEGKS
jgi:hypothetical protein